MNFKNTVVIMTSNAGAEFITGAGRRGIGFTTSNGRAEADALRGRLLARLPMRRTVQRQVDDVLSNMLLDGRLRPGQSVDVSVTDGGLRLTVSDGDDAEPYSEEGAARAPADRTA